MHDLNARLLALNEVKWGEQQHVKKRVKRALSMRDPLYPAMWYLNPAFNETDHMNVTSAWQQGFTGRGIVVSILDDGSGSFKQ